MLYFLIDLVTNNECIWSYNGDLFEIWKRRLLFFALASETSHYPQPFWKRFNYFSPFPGDAKSNPAVLNT